MTTVELNCTHPLASSAGNVSTSELYSLLLQEELQEFVLKIPALVFMIIYVCLGIPGNATVIIIYYFRFRSSTTKTFIMSLATFDFISCVIGLPFEMVDLRYDVSLDLPIVCKALRFIIMFCACGSTLILLSVAVDRFRRICLPFRRQMSVKQSKMVLVGMTVLSFFISAPTLVLYGRKTDIYKDIKMVDCTIDDQWTNTSVANGYQFILGMLWVMSILFLCIMYGIIIFKIRQQEMRRLNLTANSLASVTVSKFNHVNMNGNRKISASSIEKGGGGRWFGESSSPARARLQNRNLVDGSDGNCDNGKVGGDGEESPQQRHPLNRMFSRDVNPIYEEEDEAHKNSNARLCAVTEHEHEATESEQIVKESNCDVKENGQNVTENNNGDQENIHDVIEIKHDVTQCENDTDTPEKVDVFSEKEARIEEGGNLMAKISVVVESHGDDDDDDNNEKTPQDLNSEKSIPLCAKNCSLDNNDINSKLHSGSCPSFNVNKFGDDSDEYPTRFIDIDDSIIAATYIRSSSLPASLYSTSRTNFLPPNHNVSNCRVVRNDDNYSPRQSSEDRQSYFSEEKEGVAYPTDMNGRRQSETQFDYQNQGIPRGVSENSQKLEVLGKRYISDDRITSISDQTNGSLLTLQDSRVVQDRRRNISNRSSSIARQTSINSNSGSIRHDRTSKANSICSQSSGGRTHKTSVNYNRKQSVASTRELKTSKIAVMMCQVTMGHVLSYLPHLAIQFHRVLGPLSLAALLCNSVYFAFHHVLLRSIYLNNAINPIIYSYNNLQFRQYCAQLLNKPLQFCRRRISSYTIDSAHSLTMD